ncbi:MAG: DUF4286 family protein [Xanthomonadales bacterium]|nr:DUF4286 family protein [Xanthomonadales bacterium]
MVIYEVNLDVRRDVAEAFSRWLGPHVQEMLELPGFVSADWYERTDDSTESVVCWTTHYRLESRQHLDHYLEKHAAAMRADGVNRFGEQFSAARRILEPVEDKQ